ncbi:sigma-70 family RNA polymerase sigma factor [Paenibacillus polymyxa]|uniref:sigma-70 family RNA polymerase sigma factor n=1 Tax=Paenibacillus polymyxa TaxID=1406 RepID=UPI00307EA23C
MLQKSPNNRVSDSTKAEIERKFVSYVSNLLHFNSINFDKKNRKYNNRFVLVIDNLDESYFRKEDDGWFEGNMYTLENQISDPNLHRAFLKLSVRERQILNLSICNEAKDTEIARSLGITQQSVSKSRKNALKKLRNSLHQGGG